MRIKVDEASINVSDEAKAFANLLGIDGFCESCEMAVAKPEKYCRSCGVELEWEQDE